MALTESELLRLYLGEQIPVGGSEDDTNFSSSDIETLLEEGESVLGATVLGWQAKAAEYAKLVDVTEGPSKRSLRQRYENAIDMVAHYRELQIEQDGVGGKTQIKTIVRPATGP